MQLRVPQHTAPAATVRAGGLRDFSAAVSTPGTEPVARLDAGDHRIESAIGIGRRGARPDISPPAETQDGGGSEDPPPSIASPRGGYDQKNTSCGAVTPSWALSPVCSRGTAVSVAR
jgi:hypothetical protein